MYKSWFRAKVVQIFDDQDIDKRVLEVTKLLISIQGDCNYLTRFILN